jgi:hypothetical protein
VDGRFVAKIARFLTLVRALVYDILRFCWHSPQPYQPAVLHAFDVFIAITCNAVLSWTQANRTRAVVKFVPLVLAIYIFVDVNRHSSRLPKVCLKSVRIDLIRDNRRNWHRKEIILACL